MTGLSVNIPPVCVAAVISLTSESKLVGKQLRTESDILHHCTINVWLRYLKHHPNSENAVNFATTFFETDYGAKFRLRLVQLRTRSTSEFKTVEKEMFTLYQTELRSLLRRSS